MLTKEENAFLVYWESQRQRKKQFLRKFSIGLPLGVLIVGGSLVSLLSGWYKKVDVAVRSDSSVIAVVLLGGMAIVVFITLFAAHHKWDQNELHYREILARKETEDNAAAASGSGSTI